MNPDDLRNLLQDLGDGRLSVADAERRLVDLPFADAGVAKIDHHRHLRCGIAEVVFGSGKTVEDTVRIVKKTRERADAVLITRAGEAQAAALAKAFGDAEYNARARTVRVGAAPDPDPTRGPLLILSAGTSDLPVAEEAAETARTFGATVETVYDVGVAGLHRLLHHMPQLRTAKVIIVAAGMEGALPSVVGGLVSCPVIAVPTSVGYGASFGGVAALLGMLNTCASGVTVVNIDNGFGAAAAALRMLNTAADDDDMGDAPAAKKKRAARTPAKARASVKRNRPR